MRPNGKRRWRKWAKKLRGEDTNKIWPFATGAYLKRHDRQGYAVPRSLWPKNMELPAKPFSPRSLCGMTMGARKRLAFWDAYVPFCEENTDGTPPKSWRRRCMTAIPYDAGLHAAYNEARAKYRIGERLRPCPGCPKCGPGRLVRFVSLPRCVVVFLAGDDLYASAGPSSAWLAERTADGFKKHSIPSLAAFSRNDRVRIIDSGAHCDGSGVLPARRPK